MIKAVITGASGFVGNRLCSALRSKDICVRAVVRPSSEVICSRDEETFRIDDIGPLTDWNEALSGVDIVFHLAGPAHLKNPSSRASLNEYRRVNIEGTRRLAEIAAIKGLKRIVYLSSVKVNGELTMGRPFTEIDTPEPQNSYAISKLKAEESLRDISERYGIELVIIRSPLVYGLGVKGNLLKLLKHIHLGIPLPLGNIINKRSLISLDNLVDALILSATRAECAGQTFLLSDGQDLSTTELIGMIAAAMDKKIRLLPFPKNLFSLVSRLSPSLGSLSDRIAGSLVVDSSKFREMLRWTPPQTVADGIKSMVLHFISGKKDVS
jgi:nucleoside-diphosphate-sugar epimerase